MKNRVPIGLLVSIHPLYCLRCSKPAAEKKYELLAPTLSKLYPSSSSVVRTLFFFVQHLSDYR